MARTSEIPSAVREQFNLLGQAQSMRRGSLSERFMKCGKPGCACGDSAEAAMARI